MLRWFWDRLRSSVFRKPPVTQFYDANGCSLYQRFLIPQKQTHDLQILTYCSQDFDTLLTTK